MAICITLYIFFNTVKVQIGMQSNFFTFNIYIYRKFWQNLVVLGSMVILSLIVAGRIKIF